MTSPDVRGVDRKDNSFIEKPSSIDKMKRRPNVRKDFDEIMGDDGEKTGEMEIEKAKKKGLDFVKPGEEKEDTSKLSIFDLPKTMKSPKDQTGANVDVKKDGAAEGFNLEGKGKTGEIAVGTSDEDAGPPKYAQGHADISFVNPLGAARIEPVNALASTKVEKPVSTSNLYEIVKALMAELSVAKIDGKTETTVTLNIPGMFKGAVIVISQFDSAKGELNLAFENLTQQAKLLMDSQPNRDALIRSLSEKGYTIQMMVTTTVLEHGPIVTEEARPQSGDFGRNSEDRRGEEERKKNFS